MIEATGLWVNESKDGTKYFSGTMGKVRVIIFKNTFKEEGGNEPDYILYLDEQKKKEVPKVEAGDVPF